MNIIDLRIEELHEYENNPRFNDNAVNGVAESIREFGFKVPIIVDKNYTIIAGHTRVKAAKMLGLETVPCLIADDLTDEQVRAFRLADNKVGEFATWDFAKLSEELDALLNFDMEAFGFRVEDLDDLFREDSFDDLQERYEEPEKQMLRCPHCNHVDSKERFVTV